VSASFKLSVVTPEREVLAIEAQFAAFPAYDGEIGVMPGRSALLTQLGSGLLRVRIAGGGESTLFVSGGFAQMVDNRLTLLTEEARETSTLERAAAEESLRAAGQMVARADAEFERKQRALVRARSMRRHAHD